MGAGLWDWGGAMEWGAGLRGGAVVMGLGAGLLGLGWDYWGWGRGYGCVGVSRRCPAPRLVPDARGERIGRARRGPGGVPERRRWPQTQGGVLHLKDGGGRGGGLGSVGQFGEGGLGRGRGGCGASMGARGEGGEGLQRGWGSGKGGGAMRLRPRSLFAPPTSSPPPPQPPRPPMGAQSHEGGAGLRLATPPPARPSPFAVGVGGGRRGGAK